MGTERLMANMVDCLPELFQLMGAPAQGIPRRTHTFDLCLQSPGWMHQWDVILKRGFSSLLWFPSWLDGMRALVSFFRLSTMVSQLCMHLREDVQLPVIAEMIEQVRVPSIAEWRWGTLHTAVDALAGVLPTLSTHFDANSFKNARDPVTITRCKSALHSTAWAWQFQFVLWFTTWICGIQRWGRGCACHSDETECKWKGRRLPEAAVFVDRELSRGLQEAESWTKDTFPDHSIRTLGFSALCAGLVSHGWQEVCILAEIAVVDRENL